MTKKYETIVVGPLMDVKEFVDTIKQLQPTEHTKYTCKDCEEKFMAFINENKETMSIVDEDFKEIQYIRIDKLSKFLKRDL